MENLLQYTGIFITMKTVQFIMELLHLMGEVTITAAIISVKYIPCGIMLHNELNWH